MQVKCIVPNFEIGFFINNYEMLYAVLASNLEKFILKIVCVVLIKRAFHLHLLLLMRNMVLKTSFTANRVGRQKVGTRKFLFLYTYHKVNLKTHYSYIPTSFFLRITIQTYF